MKKKIITAMRKRPGCVPEFIEIPDELEAYQAEVGGYIEPVRVTQDLVILCNEEGKLQGLPRNCRLFGETFCGTLLFVGTRGEHFANVPMNERTAKRMFPSLWSGLPQSPAGDSTHGTREERACSAVGEGAKAEAGGADE